MRRGFKCQAECQGEGLSSTGETVPSCFKSPLIHPITTPSLDMRNTTALAVLTIHYHCSQTKNWAILFVIKMESHWILHHNPHIRLLMSAYNYTKAIIMYTTHLTFYMRLTCIHKQLMLTR